MFTERALLKAKIDLYNIVANLAKKDYIKANYHKNGKRKSKKCIPYTLSQETKEAKKYYDIVFFANNPSDITAEQEEEIKAYLLLQRFYNPTYLNDAGGNKYFNNQ